MATTFRHPLGFENSRSADEVLYKLSADWPLFTDTRVQKNQDNRKKRIRAAREKPGQGTTPLGQTASLPAGP
jgi:hypothetical protein